MGNVRKIGEVYYIEFFARGLKYQQKIGTDYDQACASLKEIEGKIERGEAALIVREVEWDIFFEDYVTNVCLDFSFSTMRRYAATIHHFRDFLNKEWASQRLLSQITPKVLEHYKSYLLKSEYSRGQAPRPRLINFTFFLLKDIFDYAIKLGYLNDNPTTHIPLVSDLTRRFDSLPSERELIDWFKTLPQPLAEILELMLYTGISLNEVLALTPSAVDLKRRTLQIGGSRARLLVLGMNAQAILEPKLGKLQAPLLFTDFSGLSLDPRALREEFNQQLKKFPGNPFKLSDLRHCFVRIPIARGVSPVILSRLLGYRDVARAFRYHEFFENYWSQKSLH